MSDFRKFDNAGHRLVNGLLCLFTSKRHRERIKTLIIKGMACGDCPVCAERLNAILSAKPPVHACAPTGLTSEFLEKLADEEMKTWAEEDRVALAVVLWRFTNRILDRPGHNE
jgi:hypothetical protein